MSKVLFLDIDGVVLPGRAYYLPNQTKEIVTTFDPCSVSLINEACAKQDRKIVIHSSWIRTKFSGRWTGTDDVLEHCINQGLRKELFHEDAYCNRDISWRYDRVNEWLARHPEVTDFMIVDDEPCPDDYKYKKHLILTDFEEGVTTTVFNKIADGTRAIE